LELLRGRGIPDRVDPAAIQDHILNVKIWTSEYDFVYDLEHITHQSSVSLPFFFIGEIKLYVFLKMNEDESDKLECSFNKTNVGQGFQDWVDVETIRDHIIKVNVLPLLPVSKMKEGLAVYLIIGLA
jgi:hypothetical protein